jgi:hypothetical protein
MFPQQDTYADSPIDDYYLGADFSTPQCDSTYTLSTASQCGHSLVSTTRTDCSHQWRG